MLHASDECGSWTVKSCCKTFSSLPFLQPEMTCEFSPSNGLKACLPAFCSWLLSLGKRLSSLWFLLPAWGFFFVHAFIGLWKKGEYVDLFSVLCFHARWMNDDLLEKKFRGWNFVNAISFDQLQGWLEVISALRFWVEEPTQGAQEKN